MGDYHDQKTGVLTYFLKPGYIYAAKTPAVVTTILGSCVSVLLYDAPGRLGGINHFLLPGYPHKKKRSTKYADTAMKRLLAAMEEIGAVKQNLTADVAGGAHFKDNPNSRQIAEENIAAALAFLKEQGIPIKSLHTGGTTGRKVIFDTRTGQVKTEFVTREQAPSPIISRDEKAVDGGWFQQ